MFDIKLARLAFEAFQLTMNVASGAEVGQAVTIDPAVNNGVKPVADGDPIFGLLDTYEDRSDSEGIITGAVSAKAIFKFEYTGAAPTPGHGAVGGATAGLVKGTGAAAAAGEAIITAVYPTDNTVEVYVR